MQLNTNYCAIFVNMLKKPSNVNAFNIYSVENRNQLHNKIIQ
jgi:hypothetical protein